MDKKLLRVVEGSMPETAETIHAELRALDDKDAGSEKLSLMDTEAVRARLKDPEHGRKYIRSALYHLGGRASKVDTQWITTFFFLLKHVPDGELYAREAITESRQMYDSEIAQRVLQEWSDFRRNAGS